MKTSIDDNKSGARRSDVSQVIHCFR